MGANSTLNFRLLVRRLCEVALVVVLLIGIACGPKQTGQTGKTGLPPSTAMDAGTEPVADAPPDSPLTEEDCIRLFDHMIALTIAEKGEKVPEEELAALRKSLIEAETPACLKVSRKDLDCGLAATSRTDLAACQPSSTPQP